MPALIQNNARLIGRDIQDNYPPVQHYRATSFTDRWLALSSGNYGYPGLLGEHNVGGSFVLRGADTTHIPTENTEYWRGGPGNQRYVGSFITNISHYQQPNLTVAAMLPSSWGAEAYSKMKPTQPVFPGLNAAYELREVPGLLRQRFLDSGLNRIGDYYLALKFGWEPLLRDVRSFVSLQRLAQQRLKQLLRDNGRPVRRRITLLDNSSVGTAQSGTLYGALQPVLSTQYYASQPTFTRLTRSRDRVWAAARFRYWLPGGPQDVAWQRKMLARLYGLTPTPSVIYNAIPWSWLVDWFTNLGHLIDNLDSGVADNLGAEYLYIMREQEWSMEQNSIGTFKRRNGEKFTVSATSVTRAFVKSRVRGGPFHPAIQEKDLNGKQLAIMGALGLSRMR